MGIRARAALGAAVLAVALACVTRVPVSVGPPQAPVFPAACSEILRVSNGSGYGWGTPIRYGTPTLHPHHVLTAAHLISTAGLVKWGGAGGMEGTATLVWRDDARDLAVLYSEAPLPGGGLGISKSPPRAGETVYFRGYLWRLEATQCGFGFVLGDDSDGDLLVWAFFHPGYSGSGVLNASGEVVGVVTGGVNWSVVHAQRDGVPSRDVGTMLDFKSTFPPALVVEHIHGRWPTAPAPKISGAVP